MEYNKLKKEIAKSKPVTRMLESKSEVALEEPKIKTTTPKRNICYSTIEKRKDEPAGPASGGAKNAASSPKYLASDQIASPAKRNFRSMEPIEAPVSSLPASL